MYQSFITALIFLSLIVCFVNPKMHKPFFIYDNSYIVEEEKPGISVPKVIKSENEVKVKTNTIKNTVNTKTIVDNSNKQPLKVSKKQNKQTKITKITQNTSAPKSTNTTKKTATPIATPKNTVQTTKTVQTPSIQENMTKEEVISWNKWRSDIQNKIMHDVKLPIMQEGTIIYFSFEVDKFGRISNIKTYASDIKYTPYTIQYLAPLIKSYQGTSILNFPKESKRFSTKFDGHFKISQREKYSTPNDYNDTEKVIK